MPPLDVYLYKAWAEISAWMGGCSVGTLLYLPAIQKSLAWRDPVQKICWAFLVTLLLMIPSQLPIQNWWVRKDSEVKISEEKGQLKYMQKWMAQAPLCPEKLQQMSLIMTGTSYQGQDLNVFLSVLSARDLEIKNPNSYGKYFHFSRSHEWDGLEKSPRQQETIFTTWPWPRPCVSTQVTLHFPSWFILMSQVAPTSSPRS